MRQATHDALTGLPNRDGLRERLAARARGRDPAAWRWWTCTGSATSTPRSGIVVGDQLLQALAHAAGETGAARSRCARASAPTSSWSPRRSTTASCCTACCMAADDWRAGMTLGELRLSVDIRAGISEWRAPRVSVEDLLRQADVALLQAKEQATVAVVYQPAHDADHRRRIMLVAELRRALAGDGLALHYQPLVNMNDRAVLGFEALLRWNHPTLGNIPPGGIHPAGRARLGACRTCRAGCWMPRSRSSAPGSARASISRWPSTCRRRTLPTAACRRGCSRCCAITRCRRPACCSK